MKAKLVLVGVGGSGSKLLATLVRMDAALKALGGEGIHLVAIDGDRVSEANLVRQAFLPSDLGRNKAEALVNRVNLLFGKGWEYRPRAFRPEDLEGRPKALVTALVTALDSGRARSEVAEAVEEHPGLWWVDLGNGDRWGQVLAGNGLEVPWPHQQQPALLTGEDEGPSCSALEALLRQDLLVNDMAALWAAEILWGLLRKGRPSFSAVFYNLDRGEVRAVRNGSLAPT
ncbi:MAG: PRTRC system ThiF family protein [Thermus sp.]